VRAKLEVWWVKLESGASSGDWRHRLADVNSFQTTTKVPDNNQAASNHQLPHLVYSSNVGSHN
jgi:hypothetical protein